MLAHECAAHGKHRHTSEGLGLSGVLGQEGVHGRHDARATRRMLLLTMRRVCDRVCDRGVWWLMGCEER